jgi:hypothetical protein
VTVSAAGAGAGSGGGSSSGSGSGSGGGGGGGGGGGASASTNPATVTDLSVSQREERRVEISFTEVGDGAGGASNYEVRYGLASSFAWDRAVPVTKGSCGSPVQGQTVGSQRTCWVDGLAAAEDYAFQMAAYRKSDEAFGARSGVVTARTQDAGIVVDVTPTSFQLELGDSRSLNAAIKDSYGNEVSGSPTWSTTASSVATVTSSGANATVDAQASGNATIRATYSGVSGSSSATVTQPISSGGGGGTSSGGGTSAPPPTGAEFYYGDFSAFTDDGSMHAHAGTTTTANVHAEPGVGMRYDFIPRPTHCGDQSLASRVSLPSGTREVWISFRIRFSANWTTVNPNCSSPAPDYKTVLTWLSDTKSTAGHDRFDLKIGQGGGNIHASVPGWPGSDNVPVSAVQQGGARAMFDGQWHTVEMHQVISGDNRATVQISIDGVVTHNYTTTTTGGLANNSLSRINIGANRNLGATELMHVWWDDVRVWTDQTGSPSGGFGFPTPTSY